MADIDPINFDKTYYAMPDISSEKDFESELYHDEYQLRLKELIDAKIVAQDVVIGNEKSPQLPLMEALRKSILEAEPTKSKPGKRKENDARKDTADLNAVPHGLGN